MRSARGGVFPASGRLNCRYAALPRGGPIQIRQICKSGLALIDVSGRRQSCVGKATIFSEKNHVGKQEEPRERRLHKKRVRHRSDFRLRRFSKWLCVLFKVLGSKTGTSAPSRAKNKTGRAGGPGS